jgi:hypothetical protein
VPASRASGTGCPHCVVSRGYSKAQIEWIQEIEIKERIHIQHALCSEGEFVIPGIGKVDGYCHETKTVYEYHGDYWHGNPRIFSSDDLNGRSGKTFGELYRATVDRNARIRASGYNLVVKWETEI